MYSTLHFGLSEILNWKLQSKPSPQPLFLHDFDQSHGNYWFHPGIMNWSGFHLKSSSEELTYLSGLKESCCLHLTREHLLRTKLSSNWRASMQQSSSLLCGGHQCFAVNFQFTNLLQVQKAPSFCVLKIKVFNNSLTSCVCLKRPSHRSFILWRQANFQLEPEVAWVNLCLVSWGSEAPIHILSSMSDHSPLADNQKIRKTPAWSFYHLLGECPAGNQAILLTHWFLDCLQWRHRKGSSATVL